MVTKLTDTEEKALLTSIIVLNGLEKDLESAGKTLSALTAQKMLETLIGSFDVSKNDIEQQWEHMKITVGGGNIPNDSKLADFLKTL